MPGQQEAAPAFSDTGPAGKGPAHIPALRSSSLLPHFKVCEFTLPFANSFGGIIFFSSLEACRHSILSSNCMKQALLEEETFSQGGLSLNHCNSNPDTSLYPSVPCKAPICILHFAHPHRSGQEHAVSRGAQGCLYFHYFNSSHFPACNANLIRAVKFYTSIQTPSPGVGQGWEHSAPNDGCRAWG